MTDRKRNLDGAPERRSIPATQFELRATAGKLTLTGYASVFNHEYDVLGGPPFGWREVVDPRAFDITLKNKPDVHLLINHEGMPLARTRSGTLKLSTDDRGLLVEAGLDRRDPDVQRLETKMARGDMDEMSFAFRVPKGGDVWSEDEMTRTLVEISIHKGDVSVVNFGANDATHTQLNSLDAALSYLAELELDEAVVEARAMADGPAKLDRVSTLLAQVRRGSRPSGGQARTLDTYRALLSE